MANSGFQGEIENMIEEIVAADKKRIALAFEQIKKKTTEKVSEAIKIAMIDNYYNGYDPLVYVRTGQLKNSVAPLIVDDSDNSGFQFQFGIKTSEPKGPSAMRHDTLSVRVTNKNGEEKIYSYKVKGYDSEIEEKIFSNFMDGIHPNAKGKTETTHVYTEINKALDALLDDGIIDRIIQDAFSK